MSVVERYLEGRRDLRRRRGRWNACRCSCGVVWWELSLRPVKYLVDSFCSVSTSSRQETA